MVETPYRGMEHQTINAYGNGYRKTIWGFDDLFQHEFAHEWFANQMTAANWDDCWLHEGFAQYMQPLYTRWRRGEASYGAHMATFRSGITARLPLVAGRPQTAEEVYRKQPGRGGDIYLKGAWVLHTLRNLIGDKAFFDAVRLTVYGRTDPMPGTVKPLYRTTPEFIAFVKQASGQDLHWFFDTYLYSGELPELIQTRNGDRLTLAWKTQGDKPFPMPIEVQVGDDLRKVAMTSGTATMAVPAGVHVIIDPMSRVLRFNPDIEAYVAWQDAQRPDGK